MGKTRLVGNDGALYLQEEATAFVGDGLKTLDELAGGAAASGAGKGFYQVSALAASSAFSWTDAEAKDYFYNDGTLVPAVGDECIPIALLASASEDTSIKSFELSLSKDKIDVTTLADKKQKTYRMGKADASGTLSGITTVGNDILKKRFMDVLDVASDGSFTMNRKTNDPLYFVGFLNDEEASGDTMIAVVGKIEIESGSLGASDGSAQEFSSGFSPSSGDRLQVINISVA